MFGADVDETDRGTYSEVIRRGGAIVAVTTDESRQDRAADIQRSLISHSKPLSASGACARPGAAARARNHCRYGDFGESVKLPG